MARKPAKSGKSRAGKQSLDEVAAVLAAVVQRIDEFCRAHLTEEYAEVSVMLAENLANERPSPLLKGKPEGWAAGIVYTVGWVNFLSDPSQNPHMKSDDLYRLIGVSEATVQARARNIRELYDLNRMDPRLTLPSGLKDNMLVWMIELPNGMIDDARRYPRSVQQKLADAGIIPFVHPDAEDDMGDGTGGRNGNARNAT